MLVILANFLLKIPQSVSLKRDRIREYRIFVYYYISRFSINFSNLTEFKEPKVFDSG